MSQDERPTDPAPPAAPTVQALPEQRTLMEQMEELREDVAELREDLISIRKQLEFAIQYMQVVTEAMGLREKIKHLETAMERVHEEQRLRERRRNGE